MVITGKDDGLGKVFVGFTTETEGLVESVKLGMIAPSNDVVKKSSVKYLINSHPEHVIEARQQLGESEINVENWWDS